MCCKYVCLPYLEHHHLYNEATTILSRSVEKSNQLNALEEKLRVTNNNREQFLEEGKALATKRKLQVYQSQMEMLFLSIKKKQAAIQCLASTYICVYVYIHTVMLEWFKSVCSIATSKQRSKFRRTVSSEKAKLEKCIQEYNDLLVNCEGFSTASVEAVIDGNFPWSLLTGLKHNSAPSYMYFRRN